MAPDGSSSNFADFEVIITELAFVLMFRLDFIGAAPAGFLLSQATIETDIRREATVRTDVRSERRRMLTPDRLCAEFIGPPEARTR
jgi:hypothetical protein